MPVHCKRTTLLLLAFGLAAGGHAQDLRFERITNADGLSNAGVNAIGQDQQGFLWIGTQDGLNKYDGYQFTVYRSNPLDSTTLTHNRIESLLVDHTGTLWVGTNEGLNRYEPEHDRFTRYQHDPDDPNSLTPGQINVLVEDHANRLWIGTQQGGLFRYEPDLDGFTRFLDDPDASVSLMDDQVRTLYQDREGTLWIGTGDPFIASITGGGLIRFDPETGVARRFVHDPDDPYSLIDDRVSALYEDRQGALWVGTCESGLHQYDSEREAFVRMQPDAVDPSRLYAPQADMGPWSSCPHVRILQEDRTGAFWIGTFNGGLHRYDAQTNTLTQYVHDPSDPGSLSNNLVWSFYEDRQGTLWIGNLIGGLHKLDPYAGKFGTYLHDPEEPGSLSNSDVLGVYEAPTEPGVLWIGTRGGGLNRLDQQSGVTTHYRHDPNDEQSLGDDTVYSIYEDRGGRLWVGTDNGLDRLDRRTGRFGHYRHDPSDPNSLSANTVLSIYEDREGVLWVGTWTGGLNRFDREREIFTRYELPAITGQAAYNQIVYTIYEDAAGTFWVASWLDALYRFDRATEEFTPYLEGSGALWLHEDASGRFWVGTQNDGLFLFDRATGTSQRYTTQDGLPSNSVYGILEDDEGHLWISTENGLSKFNPQTETFTTYDVSDGLPSNSFNQVSAHKSSSGALFFGGQGGLVSFYPDQIKENPHPPEVVLTGLRIFNESVEPGADAPLSQPMAQVEELALTHAQHDLTFEYVGLHYSNPAQNQYQYMLEGYDPGWIDAGTQRSARYTNLDPGLYTFQVKAANSDGIWNEEGASIRVTILPPWWRTTWAYVLYAMLFAAGVFAVDRIQRRRLIRKERERARIEQAELRTRALEAENKQKEIELEKTRELEQAYNQLKATQGQLIQSEKMASLGQLTAGIAHEIKNPLNFVNNFAEVNQELAEELYDELDTLKERLRDEEWDNLSGIAAAIKQNTKHIHKHGKRADAIVQSMMKHASADSQERYRVEVNAFVEEYINLAYQGKKTQVPDLEVQIKRGYDETVGSVEMAPQEMSRVLLNLLSNAFDAVHEKATTFDGGYRPEVRVTTHKVDGQVEIRVCDNGTGIPAAIQEKIFEPFFTTKPTGTGTGLGLSLSYDIVTQGHGGTLTVESTEGEGATFVITLPMNSPNTG